MQFDVIKFRIGSWALPALINDDWTGLDDGEEAMLADWVEYATDDYKDGNEVTWVFAHWGNYDDAGFAKCEVTDLGAQCVDIDAVFTITPRNI